MQKLIRFIKYNNAFTIIIALIFFSAGGAFANETSRNAIVGKTIVTRIGTDNTQIISADLDSFDMGLKINSVKEDDKFYYVNFDYNAMDVKDGVWQTAVKEKNINVLKARLGDMDLGVYLAEELKQLTDKEIAYMKEVQNIEKNKGLKKQIESVEYTGLKGLVFDDETKEIVGYDPVKKEKDKDNSIIINAAALALKSAIEEEKETEISDNESESESGTGPQVTVVKEVISKETIMKMVKEALAKEKGITLSTASTTDDAISSASSTAPTFVSDEVEAPTGSVGAVSGGEGAQSSSNSSASSSSESSSSSNSSSSESSSVTASSSSEVSSSSSEAASSSVSSSSESSISSSESAPSSVSSSESSSSSASETSSSSSSAESQPSLEATAGQASSSVSETSSSSSETSVSSSSESSASSV